MQDTDYDDHEIPMNMTFRQRAMLLAAIRNPRVMRSILEDAISEPIYDNIRGKSRSECSENKVIGLVRALRPMLLSAMDIYCAAPADARQRQPELTPEELVAAGLDPAQFGIFAGDEDKAPTEADLIARALYEHMDALPD